MEGIKWQTGCFGSQPPTLVIVKGMLIPMWSTFLLGGNACWHGPNWAYPPLCGLPTVASRLIDRAVIAYTFFKFSSHICEVQMFLFTEGFPPSGHPGGLAPSFSWLHHLPHVVSKAAVIWQKQKEHRHHRGRFLGVSGRSCLHHCCSQSIT